MVFWSLRREESWPDDDDELLDGADDDRRLTFRFGLGGLEVPVGTQQARGSLRLRDLSCGGGSGLTDLPVAVGDEVYVGLGSKVWPAAEVRWVRNTMAGFKFVNPLDLTFVQSLQKKHREKLRDIRRPK